MCIYGFVEKIQQDGVRKVSVASPFEGFYGFAVSMPAAFDGWRRLKVSVAGAVSMPSVFQWLAPFECFSGFAVSMPAAFDGWRRLKVSMASPFECFSGFAV